MPEFQEIDLRGLARDVAHTVGRDSLVSSIVIPERSVSKTHANLRMTEDGGVELRDQGSTYGTFVNNHQIVAKSLNKGDLVRFGRVAQFRFGDLRLTPSLESVGLDLLFHGVAVEAGGTRILHAVDARIEADEFVGIIGPSGCGKSSLLAALTGVYPVAEGEIVFDQDESLSANLRSFLDVTGVVPQKDLLFDDLTVRENIDFSLRIKQPLWENGRIESAVADSIRQVDLQEHVAKRTSVLSGGQRKRVNVAIELTTRPRLLLLDEPTSGLDPDLEERMLDRLKALSRRGMTVVLVAHTSRWHLFDKLLVLQPNDHGAKSSVAYCGAPENYTGALAVDEDRPEVTPAKQPRRKTRTRNLQRALRRTEEKGAVEAQIRSIFQRAWLCLFRDRFSLVLTFVLPCMTAAMVVLSQKEQTTPAQMTFFLVISGYWFGMTASVKEMLSERKLYSRDRLAGLDADAFFAGKSLFVGSIAVAQWLGLVLSTFLVISVIIYSTVGPGLHTAVNSMEVMPVIAASLAVLLAGLGGALTGLVVSILSKTERMAVTALPIILLPQILFSHVAYGEGQNSLKNAPFGKVALLPESGFLDGLLYAASLPFITRPAAVGGALCFESWAGISDILLEYLYLLLLFVLYGMTAWFLFLRFETRWNDWR